MTLTLQAVADDPALLTTAFEWSEFGTITFRPLTPNDAPALGQFLESLSAETRHCILPDGVALPSAASLCDAAAHSDKLRLVLALHSHRIVGLIEFSFGLPDHDVDRFAGYGIALDAATDFRWGSTLADDVQSNGLGTRLFPLVAEIARRFEKTRIILWDGVVSDNTRAIRYYEKLGFQHLGSYIDDGDEMLDMMLTL